MATPGSGTVAEAAAPDRGSPLAAGVAEPAVADRIRQSSQRLRAAAIRAATALNRRLDSSSEEFGALHHSLGASAADANQPGLRAALARCVGPYDDPAWAAFTPAPAGFVPAVLRCGRLLVGSHARALGLPALVPFGNGHHLLVRPQPGAAEVTRALVQSLLLRLALTSQPGLIRFHLVDAPGSGRAFSTLLSFAEAVRGAHVVAQMDEIAAQLQSIGASSEEILRSRLTGVHASLEAYNATGSGFPIPYRVLAIAGYPAGFNERTAHALLTLAESGPTTGLHVLLIDELDEASALAAPGLRLDAFAAHATTIRVEAAGTVAYRTADAGACRAEPETVPPGLQLRDWLQRFNDEHEESLRRLYISAATVAPEAQWRGETAAGVAVPIGVDTSGALQRLVLGLDTVHHALIGGATGSGKSNLLHVLIAQLALRYSPRELELYLIDFKEGVEFKRYEQLPHARTVVLESDREFALSVLARLDDLIEERGRTFRAMDVLNLPQYRKAGYELPRVVLVIDEYQLLFAEEDSITREAARLLEDLVRRGRSFGIHVVLSSQAPASATGLSRVYGQIGLRIALKCRPLDAAAILGEGNDAAARLSHPGEAIFNDEMGAKHGNRYVRVYRDDSDQLQPLAALTRSTYRGAAPLPVMFSGRAPALLADCAELQRLRTIGGEIAAGAPRTICLGEPVQLAEPVTARLECYVRSNLLIAGPNEAAAYGLLTAALASVAAQGSPGRLCIEVLDFSRPGTMGAEAFASLQSALGPMLAVHGPREAGTALETLSDELSRRLAGEIQDPPEVIVLLAGLHRWREARPADAYGTQLSEPAKRLLHLLDEGPEARMHVVLWSDGFTTIERTLKRALEFIDNLVLLRLPEADAKKVPGVNGWKQCAELADNRALFRNQEWEMERVLKFKPYQLPPLEELQRIFLEEAAAPVVRAATIAEADADAAG